MQQTSNTLALLLIGLNNTSNKEQVSKSLNFQLLKKSCGRRRQNATQSAMFATARRVSAICRILLSFCSLYVKYMCFNYLYSSDSVRIESSLLTYLLMLLLA